MPIVPVALAALFYTAYALFVARAAGRIDPLLSSGLVNAIGAALPLALYAALRARGVQEGALAPTPLLPGGLLFSVLAGLAIAAFGYFLMKAFAGGAVSYVIPVVYGSTIALSTLIGWAVFRESMSPLQLAGIAAILGGLAMIVLARAG